MPITKALLRQIILALLLRCHSSFRGAILFLSDIFGFTVSIGTIHNVVKQATQAARRVNGTVTLEKVDVGCHDEIYQAGAPVLVGIDSASTFCYLLEAAESRDDDMLGLAPDDPRRYESEERRANYPHGLIAPRQMKPPSGPCSRQQRLHACISFDKFRGY